MAIELQAPKRFPPKITDNMTTIFLAGSIEMGKAEPWQDKLVKEFENNNDILFYNPRRSDWDSSWKQDPTPGTQFHEQVTWELHHIDDADIVIFYFDPKTQSPITLMELGIVLANSEKHALVCCPDGFFRKGNVVITCNAHGVEVLDSYEELVRNLELLL